MSLKDEVPFVTRSFVDYSGDFSPRAVSITWRTQPFFEITLTSNFSSAVLAHWRSTAQYNILGHLH